MATLWFFLIALMLTMYVILDGFDLGAGVAHLYVARTDTERRSVLQSIGPFWDGNEVWLIASGAVMLLAFPLLYASSLSGFYLPLIILLWLLILRAVSIEFRSHLTDAVWRPFWDAVFAGASVLLSVFFGAALGNVVRGVPLDSDGYFFSPLWTTFGIKGPETGILDWYTVVVAVTALLAMTVHGAMWLVLKNEGNVRERALRLGRATWLPLLIMIIVLTVITFRVQPHIPERFVSTPIGWLFPLMALGALAGIWIASGKGRERGAFLFSCAFLAGMMLSVAFGLYPNLLPALNDPAFSLTVHNAAAPSYGLRVALIWWVPGVALVAGYTIFVYRKFAGKVRVEENGEGY